MVVSSPTGNVEAETGIVGCDEVEPINTVETSTIPISSKTTNPQPTARHSETYSLSCGFVRALVIYF